MADSEEQKRDESQEGDDDDKHYQCVFAEYDKNGNGVLCRDELADVLRSIGQNPTEANVSEMLEELDENNDGVIDYKEFLRLAKGGPSCSERDEDLIECFRVFDTDNAGFLTAEQLRAGLEGRGESFTLEDTEELIREVDINNDGKLDYREFVKLMATVDSDEES